MWILKQTVHFFIPFLPWKLLLKPEWFISLQLWPGVPWKSNFSLLPFASSIFCFRMAYVPKRAGFWTRSIFTMLLPHVCWKRLLTSWYSRTSCEGSNLTRCTVFSKPCRSFGCGDQWFGTSTPIERQNICHFNLFHLVRKDILLNQQLNWHNIIADQKPPT